MSLRPGGLIEDGKFMHPRTRGIATNCALNVQGQSRRPAGGEKKSRFGRSKGTADAGDGGGKPQVKKATFESTKKKEIGVSDLTLLSKISNEAINDNLKIRFEHGEIYVGAPYKGRESSLLA